MMSDDLRIWLNHFEYHAQRPRSVPCGLSDLLSPEEQTLIASSIATFQLGEQSGGATLLRATERFARRHHMPALVRIMELFIREEQRHAALLKEFMEDHQIPLKSRDWTDGAFRALRRLAGLELYLQVLISAELIGNVYYRALEAATGCRRLKVLCRTLVGDELAHVAFESQLLLALRSRRSAPARALMRLAHRTLFAGTAGVVWLTHRPVLRRTGYDARGFVRMCLAQYAFYLEPTNARLPGIEEMESFGDRGPGS
jgi:tRNA isopentenyl-2-thiomethyl-A-37 hydroxylase MiaE